MASSNSIRIRELEEQKRKNDADIDVARKKVQLEESRLAEDIRNNLRNYNINLDKNQITKLANDQLNERELMSIIETMRNNLAKEVETNRHNLKQEELTLAEQAIKKMDVLLQAGKPTGKDAKAIVTSYLLNQTLLQAFGGTSVPAEAYKWITDSFISNAENEVGDYFEKYGDRSNGFIKYTDQDGKIKSGILKGKYFNKETGEVYDTYKEYKESKKNEIPTDFSNSRGPSSQGGNNEKLVNQEKTTSSGGSGDRISDDRSNRKENIGPGANIESSSSGKSASVIYSPGSEKKTGPGWGLFN